MSSESIIWLFPVFFMLHELEEIIFLPAWLKRNSGIIAEKYPRIYRRIEGRLSTMSTRGFAVAVAEEFILVSLATLISVEMMLYSFFVSLLIMYSMHVVIHCVQSLALRRYIPAVGTGVLSVFYSLFAIAHLHSSFTLDGKHIMITTPILFAVMVLNLLLVHRAMGRFDSIKSC